jgi:hypothetical protein
MNISLIGHSIVKPPIRNLMLKNVLYAHDATKNLVYVHKLASENSAFLHFLSTILTILLLRTEPRGNLFLEDGATMGCTPFR